MIAMIGASERKVLRRFFDERELLVRALLDTIDAHEKGVDAAREALAAISAAEDLSPNELRKKAQKALEDVAKALGGGQRVSEPRPRPWIDPRREDEDEGRAAALADALGLVHRIDPFAEAARAANRIMKKRPDRRTRGISTFGVMMRVFEERERAAEVLAACGIFLESDLRARPRDPFETDYERFRLLLLRTFDLPADTFDAWDGVEPVHELDELGEAGC